MSATRILVLGVVQQLGQAHGYQVRRELLRWRADIWAKINPGSIYQALRTLTKRNLLEPVATEAARGPERTVYRLTPDGETEFLHLVRTAISDPLEYSGAETLNAAFAFLHLLGRGEVADLLGYRVRSLQAQATTIGSLPVEDGTPPQVEALNALYTAEIHAGIAWAEHLAARIRAGAYTFADDRSSSLTSRATVEG